MGEEGGLLTLLKGERGGESGRKREDPVSRKIHKRLVGESKQGSPQPGERSPQSIPEKKLVKGWKKKNRTNLKKKRHEKSRGGKENKKKTFPADQKETSRGVDSNKKKIRVQQAKPEEGSKRREITKERGAPFEERRGGEGARRKGVGEKE